MQHHIGIIGAGPRGTYALRRLALRLEKEPLNHTVNIHVIEKSGNFGGGGVHSVSQPNFLRLNTIGSQITAFGDDDHEARSSAERKTLHEWLVFTGHAYGPNDYPSRAEHGKYLAAMFDWTESRIPPGITIHRHHDCAVDIDTDSTPQAVLLRSGKTLPADEILLLTGHAENRIKPGSAEEAWSAFASRQRNLGKPVSYLHMAYPLSSKTMHIKPGETVYVIGMGLTAIDTIKTFSVGRGGRFENSRYIPSGNEPTVIIGSRLGLPYSARGYNQKTDQYKGRILTPDTVRRLKSEKQKKINFVADLLPLVLREMEFVYYSTLKGKDFGENLLAFKEDGKRKIFIERHVAPESRFSWEDLENPFRQVEAENLPGAPWFQSLEDYTAYVLDYLGKDIAEAEKGNMASPLKNAVDSVLRDLRDVLRMAVDKGGLTAESHRYLTQVFNRINNRVAVGPPVSSTKELVVLAKMGLVSFSGPSPRLVPDEGAGCFFIESDLVKGSKRRIDHVINGRIHSVDCKNDSSPLIQNLFRRKLVRTYINRDGADQYELGGLDVTDEFHIIGADGSAHRHICAIGIPIEGKFWFNAADARPDVNSNAISQLSRWADAAVLRLKHREL
jgi:uncharacterized NAD(P)/FAD-binding protein YdhS